MFREANVYSSYSIDDAKKAREFYGDILGIEISEIAGMEDSGMFNILPSGDSRILLYERPSHQPAAYTVLNILIGKIDTAVDELTAKGIEMLRYDGFIQDDKGVMRGLSVGQGPDIAWFTDPAGNIISLQQEILSSDNQS